MSKYEIHYSYDWGKDEQDYIREADTLKELILAFCKHVGQSDKVFIKMIHSLKDMSVKEFVYIFNKMCDYKIEAIYKIEGVFDLSDDKCNEKIFE